jgi:CopG family nickel-responsive transcriptional regulator
LNVGHGAPADPDRVGEVAKIISHQDHVSGFNGHIAARDALRTALAEYEVSRWEQGTIAATITTISEYGQRDVDERLTRLRHEYDALVTGNMHIHLGSSYCLEVFIVQGAVDDVLTFVGRVRAIRGIQQVKYTVVPLAP